MTSGMPDDVRRAVDHLFGTSTDAGRLAALRALCPDSGDAPIDDERYYSIGESSALLGVTTVTLRYWDEVYSRHLRVRRTRGGQRRYSGRQMRTMLVIGRMLDAGLRHTAITVVLDATRRVEM